MLTLAFFATPGSLGASTAALGAALAVELMQQEPHHVRIYSDRPHPHVRRTHLIAEPRSSYNNAASDLPIAIYDASDSLRPRTPREATDLTGRISGPTLWFPIVGKPVQSLQFTRALTLRPAIPLWVERPAGGDTAPLLPPIDDLCRQVLEGGVTTLGYTPKTALRRWTQAWLDLLAPIITEAQRAEALST